MIIKEETLNICSYISSKIVLFFGVDIESIYIKRGTEKMQNAREFSWFILHREYYVSINKLSIIFKKTPRTITRGISKIKHGILKQRYYQSIYEELKEFLNKKKIEQAN